MCAGEQPKPGGGAGVSRRGGVCGGVLSCAAIGGSGLGGDGTSNVFFRCAGQQLALGANAPSSRMYASAASDERFLP